MCYIVHTQIYDRSTESPKSHGKVSMCLDKDNLNNSTTNIASVSDNRLSSHNDIMVRELMNIATTMRLQRCYVWTKISVVCKITKVK